MRRGSFSAIEGDREGSGQTRAIISEDVFSYDGSRLLIPRGSRLIGRYRSGIEIAQKRAEVFRGWPWVIVAVLLVVLLIAFIAIT